MTTDPAAHEPGLLEIMSMSEIKEQFIDAKRSGPVPSQDFNH